MVSKVENLKVGDAVCIVRRGSWNGRIHSLEKGQVERVTATQITAMDGRRFLRRNGAEVGKGNTYLRAPRIEALTDEILAEHAASREQDSAENACGRAYERLRKARGNEAVRLAAMLPDELKRPLE